MPHRAKLKGRQTKRPEKIDETALEAFEQGEGNLAKVLHLGQSDLQNLRQRAIAFVTAGRFEKAKAIFEMLDNLGDQNAGIDLMLALCCDQLGDVPTAKLYFNRGLGIARASDEQSLIEDALSWGAHLLTTEATS